MADNKITLRVLNAETVEKLIKATGKSVQDVLEVAMHAGGEVVVGKADELLVEVDNGIGKETAEKTDKVISVHVGVTQEKWYARFLETGTKPHGIKAKRAGALRFFYFGSRTKILKKVRHLGFAARPFLRPAVDENIYKIRKQFGEVIKKAIE
jgi:HK97 gp10 family phage protein